MKPQGGRPIDLHEVAKILRAKDLCDVERHLREKGCPEFEYEGELADWALLWERGCWTSDGSGSRPPLLPAACAAGGAFTPGLE